MTVIIATNNTTKKVTSSQERLEAIFNSVDSIKADLNKCGMRLQEAKGKFNIPCFVNSKDSFEATYGLADLMTSSEGIKGRTEIDIPAEESHHFAKNQRILLYNAEQGRSEINSTIRCENGTLYLQNELANYYACNSIIIILRTAKYFYDSKRLSLKRRVDGGKYAELMGGVSDFYVAHFPDANSVLYRIEVEKKEQIRGYIFMLNNVL
jgi:hypothetical protein